MRNAFFRMVMAMIVAVAPLNPPSASAWGRHGHVAVAKVADSFLTDKARQQISELLGNANIYDVPICLFADVFKKTPAGKFTSSWHFVDIPANQPSYDSSRDCLNNNCVVAQIERQKSILKDASVPRSQRIMALKFLIHFVGDIHQPLHCCERNHDTGGNDIPVRFLDLPGVTNLHSVWDDNILDVDIDSDQATDYADSIQARITTQQQSDWENVSNPVDWANESHRLAVDFAYHGIQDNRQNPQVIDSDYVATAKPIVERQIQKGGVRLARLLNEVFK